MVDGLLYMHQMNVCHRDIKLENTVIDDKGIIKLVDFGLGIDVMFLLHLYIKCSIFMLHGGS